MARKSAIPQDNREWPDYVYRPFPRYIGCDEMGQDLIAQSEAEVEELEARRVYPRVLGLDARGNTITAHHPDELKIKKGQVVRPAAQVAEAAETENKELEEENNRLRAQLAESDGKSSKGGAKKKAA